MDNNIFDTEVGFTLACIGSELAVINARIIDVMLLDKETREKHMDKINELLEEKKILQKIIIDYRKKQKIK